MASALLRILVMTGRRGDVADLLLKQVHGRFTLVGARP